MHNTRYLEHSDEQVEAATQPYAVLYEVDMYYDTSQCLVHSGVKACYRPLSGNSNDVTVSQGPGMKGFLPIYRLSTFIRNRLPLTEVGFAAYAVFGERGDCVSVTEVFCAWGP